MRSADYAGPREPVRRIVRIGVSWEIRTDISIRALSIRAVFLVALLAGAVSAPRPASAQGAGTPADSAAVLLATASEFESRGEGDIAEALFRYIADRFPGTPAAEAALARLDAAMAARSRGGGETELKVWSALYGIWLGVAVPAALDVDGPEPYGLGLLVGGPTGFLAGRALANSRPLSLGQVRAITWGGTWGALQGMGWANALDLGGGERLIEGDILIDEEQSTEAVVASAIAGSAVGIAGGILAARREITPGTSTSAMLGSLWGAWFGLASAALTDMDENTTWATMMVTGNAGLAGGALAGSRWPLSRSRARLISVGGLMGGVGGIGLVLITQPDDDDAAITTILVGSVAGLLLGVGLTEDGSDEQDPTDNAQAAGAFPAPGALLNWSRGEWSLSAPLPAPVREPNRRGDGRDGLVWKVPLLNVRF